MSCRVVSESWFVDCSLWLGASGRVPNRREGCLVFCPVLAERRARMKGSLDERSEEETIASVHRHSEIRIEEEGRKNKKVRPVVESSQWWW